MTDDKDKCIYILSSSMMFIILVFTEAPAVDLLMCGSCKRTFELSNIQGFMKHKKFDCEDPGNLAGKAYNKCIL